MLEIDEEKRPTARGLLTALPKLHQVKQIFQNRHFTKQQRVTYKPSRNSFVPQPQRITYQTSPIINRTQH